MFLIGGHFIFPLGDLQRAPPTVLSHLLTQRLVDVDTTSYHAQGSHPYTRIDGALANPRVMAMVTGVAALRDTGIPGHLPVVFTVAMEAVTQRLVKVMWPRPVAVPKREGPLRLELEERLAAPLRPKSEQF